MFLEKQKTRARVCTVHCVCGKTVVRISLSKPPRYCSDVCRTKAGLQRLTESREERRPYTPPQLPAWWPAWPVNPADLLASAQSELEARLWHNLRGSGDECWLSINKPNSEGYGQIRYKDVTYSVHRLAFQCFHRREVKPGMQVQHLCNARSCGNPSHLIEGTHAQNMAYMRQSGRNRGNQPVLTDKATGL